MSYFPPAPKSSMDMDRVMQYVQRNAHTFYQQLTLRGISATNISGSGTLTITGNTTLGGTLFVTGNSTFSTIGTSGAATFGSTVAITGTTAVAGEPAYYYKETVVYAADNTFTKADYPGLRAVMVEMVGGGGAGGSCALTGSDQYGAGGGGGGGGYAKSWVLAADIDTTEAVTVAAGGTPGAAGANAGGNGEDSVFDTISGEVRAEGGEGGAGGAATAGATMLQQNTSQGGDTNTGNIITIEGSDGLPGFNRGGPTTAVGNGGYGGSSFWGGVTRQQTANANGLTGSNYGGGGSGGANSESQASGKQGGAGGPGLVVVHVYV